MNHFLSVYPIANYIFSIVQNLRGGSEGEESNNRRKHKRENNIKIDLRDSS
jgi:hypothetical protein